MYTIKITIFVAQYLYFEPIFMQKSIFYAFITAASVLMACQKTEESAPMPTIPDAPVVTYSFDSKPVWQDEFSNNGLPDATKWSYDVGGSGWGNNELQYYTNATLKNARIENGKLIIEAHKEELNNKNYTSARLVTKNKGDWTYGKFVIRAKLPQGRGTWPAIWMLATGQNYGTAYWPDNGEIDIMEHVGYDPNNVHCTIHTKSYNHGIGTQKEGIKFISSAITDFHDYAVEWTPQTIKGYIDDQLYFTFMNDGGGWQGWPFDKPQHLLLNIAVGGNWGGAKGIDDSIWPQRMEIEYVRVYPLVKN
jgi:beta-glucanase (GH16 family)